MTGIRLAALLSVSALAAACVQSVGVPTSDDDGGVPDSGTPDATGGASGSSAGSGSSSGSSGATSGSTSGSASGSSSGSSGSTSGGSGSSSGSSGSSSGSSGSGSSSGSSSGTGSGSSSGSSGGGMFTGFPESFEAGTDGWAFLNKMGTDQQTTAFATDGMYGLSVSSPMNSTSGDWLGLQFSPPLDLSADDALVFDLQTLAVGTSPNIVIQSGSSWKWCQSSDAAYVGPTTTKTVTMPFSSLVCTPDLTHVDALYIWFNTGSFNIDDVRLHLAPQDAGSGSSGSSDAGSSSGSTDAGSGSSSGSSNDAGDDGGASSGGGSDAATGSDAASDDAGDGGGSGSSSGSTDAGAADATSGSDAGSGSSSGGSDAGWGNTNAAATMPESFETGTNGWAFLNGGGSELQTTAFHTSGSYGLQVVSPGDWLGVQFPSPLDFTGDGELVFDLETLSAGTSPNIVVQSGSSWTWCATNNAAYINSNTTKTVTMHFSSLGCAPTLTQVDAVYIWFNPGTFYLDNVRAVPAPTSVLMDSFESGTDNWAQQNPGVGTTAQESTFATDGTHGLSLNVTTSGWFGAQYASPLDLTGMTQILFDIQTGASGTSPMIVVQSGSGWTWCQSPQTNIGANTTSDGVSFSLSNLSCTPTLSQVHAFYIWFNTGSFNLDNVRASQ